jgi:hypothetical protein
MVRAAFLTIFWLGVALRAAELQTSPLTSEQIIARMLERAKTTPQRIAAQCHACIRNVVAEEYDYHGKLKDKKVREFAVEMNGAELQLKLLKFDGRTPTEREAKKEVGREMELKKKYGERKDKPKGQGPDFLDESLLGRYRYEAEGLEVVNGRKAYRVTFEPAGRESGKDTVDKALGLLAGHFWVDAEEFELVKVKAHLTGAVSVGAGVIGSVDRLDFLLERERQADGFWFNRTLKTDVEGRKVFLGFRTHSEIEQHDFKPLPASADGGSQ